MHREIPLTRGLVAIVDAADFDWLNQWKWHAKRSKSGYYAARKRAGQLTFMHRLVLDTPQHLRTDHINGNTLDNRRENLRTATPQQNACNRGPIPNSSSQYKGVGHVHSRGKWVAQIKINSRTIRLGYFANEIDAARAYDAKALELFGEFAYLNFPQE